MILRFEIIPMKKKPTLNSLCSMTNYRSQLTEAMENQNGVIYLWNGQGIVNCQPRKFENTSITKRVGPKKIYARIVYVKGK